MQYIDFSAPCRVHFTGIGGISMSGLAELLLHKGFTVSGSDRKPSDVSRHLEELGIDISYSQTENNITDDIKVLVYTAAVKQDNPELVKAASLNIPTIDRATLVGDIMLHYTNNYAVAGTHGKTTSTSMLSLILIEAGLDPTINLGGILDSIGGNTRIGSGENFCLEACEYTDSFLKFHPTRAMITNIEPEHLDYFKCVENEYNSFRTFASYIPADGILVANASIPSCRTLFGDIKGRLVTYDYSRNDNNPDYYATDVTMDELGAATYTLCHHDDRVGTITLNVPGEHNVTNSVGVAALALESGIDFKYIVEAIRKYGGTHRRFELKGTLKGVQIIDDYAHHPTEMTATIRTALSRKPSRLVVVFQPHTYSRTAQFKEEICEALSAADIVVLTDIYAAREVNTFGISPDDLVEILRTKYGKEVYHFSSFDEIENFLLGNCSTGDMLITMGAGDVVTIGEKLLGI